MALATRSSRRASGRRWLAVGVVVTILVLLIDASVRSRSPDPTRRLAGSVWADKAFALVQQSNVQGRQLTAFLADTTPSSGAAARLQLGAVRSGAASTLRAAQALGAPAAMSGVAGLLDTCLLVRSQEATAITGAVFHALAAPIGVGAITSASKVLATGIQRLEVADAACALFAKDLPGWLHVRAPKSQWIHGTGGPGTTPAGEAVFLTALHRRVNLKARSAVAIEAISTTPSAVGTRNGVQILTSGHQLTVDVVVGNTGNRPEQNLTLSASISPATGTSTAHAFIGSLQPGTSEALTLGGLAPPVGRKVTLTVTLTPAAGDPAKPKTTTLEFEMPSPNSSVPSTSSTTTKSHKATTSGSSGTTGTSGSTTTSSTSSTTSTTTTSGTSGTGVSGTGTTGVSGSTTPTT